MPVEQPDQSLTQKETMKFAGITLVGAAGLLLGLALIIFAQYHERAYIFLIPGAGAFIGGIAGMIAVGRKARAASVYGLIAMGIVGMIVGLNYLIGSYGPSPNQAHGYLVITLSVLAILAGLIGGLVLQSRSGFAGLSSVIMLGVIGSIGLAALIVGTVLLAVLDYPGYAYFLLATGAICLIAGIVCGVFAQRRASTMHG
jgi:hypothetical protein